MGRLARRFEEKTANLLRGLGILRCAVVRRDDLLACGGLQVRTPVGHNAIGAIGRVPFAAIADDGVVGDVLGERQSLDGLQNGRSGFEKADAVRRKREESPQLFPDGFDKDPPVSPIDGPRHLDEADRTADQGIVRNRAAAMRSRHIDYSGDVPPGCEFHHVCDHAPRLGAEVELFEGGYPKAPPRSYLPARGQ